MSPLIFTNQTPDFLRLGDGALNKAHNESVGLFVDKHIVTAIPNVQTVLLLESTGLIVENIEANLHEIPGKRYFTRWCTDKRFIWSGFDPDHYLFNEFKEDPLLSRLNEQKRPTYFDNELINGYFKDVHSQFLEPVVKGGSWNPYLRYRSSRNSGSIQCGKWQGLVGGGWNNAKVNDLVFTYPQELSNVFLFNPEYRSVMEKRCKRCFKKFLDFYKIEVGVPHDKDIAVSESFHPWSTSNPVKPHLHHHVDISHFVFKKISEKDRKYIESLYRKEFNELGKCLNDSGDIIDLDRFNKLYSFLDNELQLKFGFELLDWKGSFVDEVTGKIKKVPLDNDRVKEIWSDCVKEEFVDLLDPDHWFSVFDVHFQFFSVSDKKRFLHSLSYKCRPPVVDVDLFFRRNKDVVLNYDKLNLSNINDPDTRFFLEESASPELVNDWLKYLVRHKTKTSVFGFWRILKRYMVVPDSIKVFVPRVCPICGGALSISGIYSKVPLIDSVFIKFGSKFKVVRLWDDGG